MIYQMLFSHITIFREKNIHSSRLCHVRFHIHVTEFVAKCEHKNHEIKFIHLQIFSAMGEFLYIVINIRLYFTRHSYSHTNGVCVCMHHFSTTCLWRKLLCFLFLSNGNSTIRLMLAKWFDRLPKHYSSHCNRMRNFSWMAMFWPTIV